MPVGNYYPIDITISSLVEADVSKQFVITWDYNAPTKNDGGVRYFLQRYISDYPVNQNDDIICCHDYYDWRNPGVVAWQMRYNFITINDAISGTTYTDVLGSTSTLSRHGFTWDGTTWRDSDNRDVVDDILKAKRQIYYRLAAFDRYANFNLCSNWYVGYDDCYIEAHSTVSQVKANVRYLEGDLVGYGDIGQGGGTTVQNMTALYTGIKMGIPSLAVDIQYIGSSRSFYGDYRNDRAGNLWIGTGWGWTANHCCSDLRLYGKDTWYIGYTGYGGEEYGPYYNRIIGRIVGQVIDPDTGDSICACETTNRLIRCNYDKLLYNLTYGDPIEVQQPLDVWTDLDVNPYNYYNNGPITLTKYTGTQGPNNTYALAIVNGYKDIANWDITKSKYNYRYGRTYSDWWGYNDRIAFGSHVLATFPLLAGICTGGIPWSSSTHFNLQAIFVNSYVGNLTPPPRQYIFSDIGTIWNLNVSDWVNEGINIAPALRESARFTTCTNRNGLPCGPGTEPTRTHHSMTSDLSAASNIWTTNYVENCVNKVGSVSGYLTPPIEPQLLRTVTVNNPVDICVDSENNIWVTSDQSNHLKIYQLDNSTSSTEFPYGYECRWPSDIDSETSWPYGQWRNDKYVEYVLSRDHWSMTSAARTAWCALTATFDGTQDSSFPYDVIYWSPIKSYQTQGVRIKGTIVEQRQQARAWYNTYCHPSGPSYNANNQIGMRVYPRATSATSTYTVPRKHTAYATSTDPRFNPGAGIPHVLTRNSDSTGAKTRIAAGTWPSIPRIFSPAYTYPEVGLRVTSDNSTPMLNDGTYWNTQSTTSSYNVSGYDDLSINIELYISNDNSFDMGADSQAVVIFGDKSRDICGDTGCACTNSYPDAGINSVSAVITLPGQTTYTYHDPSQSGKPGNRHNGGVGTSTGYYTICAGLNNVINNPYLLYGTVSAGNGVVSITGLSGETDAYNNIVNNINVSKTVTVWERWPTAKVYVQTFDMPVSIVDSIWDYTARSGAGANTSDVTSPTRIVSGYDPLSAQFIDYSIARTWPLSSWHFNFGDSATYPSTLPSSLVALTGSKYNGLTTMHLTASDPNFHPRDSQTYHYDFAEHVYMKPGTYYATLYVQASNTGTESATTDGSMTCAITCQILVLETCPNAHILISSANTVSSNYSYDSLVYPPTGLTNAYISPNRMYVSGYAPYLTVTFLDSSVPVSYPISSYRWDFDDWYTGWETSVYDTLSTVNATTVISGSPYWITDKTNHTTEHTYIYPGLYMPSLNVYTSGNSTPSCEVATVSVYVEELPPTACFEIGTSPSSFGITNVSGVSPLTVYFNASCIIEGSFPICQIDWDFGDGSPILSVTRYPSAEVFIGPIAYPEDPADPRNVIVSHTFIRNTSADDYQFNVQVTVYACGTDTTSQTPSSVSGFDVTVNLSNPNNNGDPNWLLNNMNIDNIEHLIANRVYDTNNNNIVIFEGQVGTAYNYLLSGN